MTAVHDSAGQVLVTPFDVTLKTKLLVAWEREGGGEAAGMSSAHAV